MIAGMAVVPTDGSPRSAGVLDLPVGLSARLGTGLPLSPPLGLSLSPLVGLPVGLPVCPVLGLAIALLVGCGGSRWFAASPRTGGRSFLFAMLFCRVFRRLDVLPTLILGWGGLRARGILDAAMAPRAALGRRACGFA